MWIVLASAPAWAGLPADSGGCDSGDGFICYRPPPAEGRSFAEALEEECEEAVWGYLADAYRCTDDAGATYDVVEVRALYSARIEYFDPKSGALLARYRQSDTPEFCCGSFARWQGGPIEGCGRDEVYECGDTARNPWTAFDTSSDDTAETADTGEPPGPIDTAGPVDTAGGAARSGCGCQAGAGLTGSRWWAWIARR